MKGLFIILFAMIMIACGAFCCERKVPDAEVGSVVHSHAPVPQQG